jgi:hypothetical protein
VRKGKTALLFMVMAMVCVMGCSNTRILQQTPDTAIIAGYGGSMPEAKIAAEEKAAELFGRFAHTKDTDCTQEFKASASHGKARAKTYWVCTITVKKVK